MAQKIFKGLKQIKGFGDDFNIESLEDGYLYLIRSKEDSSDEGYLFFNGKRYGDVSNKITAQYVDDKIGDINAVLESILYTK